MADRQVKVTLSAQVQGYIASMREAAEATKKAGTQAEKLADQSQAFNTMGRTAMLAGGAVAAGMALSTKAAIDWDTAWAGVRKTVDGSDQQMASLEGQLRDLAKTLPATHTEIAAVAEAAGQLGIERESVAGFTRTMIDLGETTNLTANDAATQLARFMTVMGTSQDTVSGLGSALVDLGNNYATTEAEIMAMGMRLSGAGAQIGMTEGQVLGLSTALSSVGIEAEAGGSAMSKVMIDIASSVEKGGERVQKFADVAGMSADQFSEKWRTAPGEALAAFVTGLRNAEAQGKSTFGILEDLGITEVRMRDALLRSAQAADKFAGAMAQGDDAMRSNTALAAEAEKRYDTTAAKLSTMSNQVVDAAISLGEHLLPAVEVVADGVGGFANLLAGLDGPMGAVAAWSATIASGLLLAGGSALLVVPQIAEFKKALTVLEISMGSVAGGASRVIGFLGNPWVLGLTAAASVIGVLVAEQGKLSAQARSLADTLDETTGAITKNSAAWAANELQQQGVLSAAGRLGVGAEDMTQAWLGNADALERVNERLELWRTNADFRSENSFKGWSDDLVDLDYALDGSNKVLAEARTRHDELTEATGASSDASRDAADAGRDQESSLEGVAAAAAATQEAVSALADEIRGFGSESFNAEKAAIKLEESYAALEEAVSNGGGSLDKSTEAGRDTTTMLLDMASAANESAAATLQLTGDQDAANASLDKARQSIIDYRMSLGESQPEAEAWANSIVASSAQVSESMETVKSAIESLPPETIVQVDAETAAALEGIEGVNVTTIDDKTAYVYGDNADADAKIQAIIDKNPDDKSVRLTGEDSAFWGAWANIQNTPLTKVVSIVASGMSSITSSLSTAFPASANGNLFEFANGGGLDTGIYSGGKPITRFAESETVWEAFISGKPDQRDRNRQIWAETGNRLGMGQAAVSASPVVYVQNPFTGEYLLAKQTQIADGAVDRFIAESASERRRFGG